jgi:hypothetical protein
VFSASKACWRILSFSLSNQQPFTVRLQIHLKGEQCITFDKEEKLSEIVNV